MVLLLPVMPVLGKGSKSGSIPVTEAERANAEVAAKSWNDYVTELKPMTEAYVADVRSDVTPRVETAQGMANADIMQKVGTPTINPNQPGAVTGMASKLAMTKSTSDLNVESGVKGNQASELQGVLDIGQGKATTATAGMADLASQAAKTAFNDNEMDYNTDTSMTRSLATGAGMVAGWANNKKTA
jgi:hypothetical protein